MLPEKTNDTARQSLSTISEVTTPVDIDFRNTFIAMSHLMSQAELWRTIIEFHIPVEQIYGNSPSGPKCLRKNNHPFQTGAAQGSIAFNIFINALLRMLTATG